MSAEPQPNARHASTAAYLWVWLALIVMTVTTVGLTFVEMGPWHQAIGLSIAVVKATLIVLIFMHALEAGRLTWIVITAMVLFLALLFTFTWADYATRGLDNAVRDPAANSARP